MIHATLPLRRLLARTVRWAILLVLPLSLAATAAAATADDADGEAVRFDILEFEVTGNTTLPAITIEKALMPFLGPGRSIEDVEEARAALERAYQQAGYLTVVVNVPIQKVDEGVVRLDALEATVERLRVSGARYYSGGYIRERLASIREGEVPYFPDIQRDLARFNQVPGRNVTPVLKPGRTPGTVEIEAKVADESPLHGSIELNNRQVPNTEPLRLSASMRYDNLWGRDHSISFLALVSPEDTSQVRVLSGNYLFRLPGSDRLISFYAVRSRSNLAAVGALTVLGDANIYGARMIIPMPARENYYHSFIAGLDYKDFLEDLRFTDGDGLVTPIDYTPLAGGYQFTQVGRKGTTRGNLTANLAIRGDLFGNQQSEFALRRFNANANYFCLRGELSRLQNLTNRLKLYAKVGGQAASQPLINTEQYFIGGVDTVRGYFEAEAAGDNGVNGTLELRVPWAAPAGPSAEVTAAGFVDAAQVWIKDPLPSQVSKYELLSAGVGLRYRAERTLAALLDVGVPLRATAVTRRGDPFLHFRVAYDF